MLIRILKPCMGKEIRDGLVVSEMGTRERGQGVSLFDIMTLEPYKCESVFTTKTSTI